MIRDKKRVLLVDDVVEIRHLLRILLANVQFCQVVGEAEDGREAIELTQQLQPDVIVLDVQMPGMSGLEALPAIFEAAPHSAPSTRSPSGASRHRHRSSVRF